MPIPFLFLSYTWFSTIDRMSSEQFVCDDYDCIGGEGWYFVCNFEITLFLGAVLYKLYIVCSRKNILRHSTTCSSFS